MLTFKRIFSTVVCMYFKYAYLSYFFNCHLKNITITSTDIPVVSDKLLSTEISTTLREIKQKSPNY